MANSLKGKRAILNRVRDRVRSRFNVSVAEIEANEVWNYACVGVCLVANQEAYANRVLDKVLDLVEEIRDCQVEDHFIEFVRV